MGSCISSIHTKNPPSSKVDSNNSSSFSIPPTPTKDINPPPFESPLHSCSSLTHNSKISSFMKSVSSYLSHGSREDSFYDTQAWVESDCEEDFYSVNGDFTPRSNTPVHHSIGTPRLNRAFSPQVNRALFEGRPSLSASFHSQSSSSVRRSISSTHFPGNFSEGAIATISESSSKSRRKSLVDLFRESMRERDGVGLAFAEYETETNQKMETSPSINGLPPKPPTGNSPLSCTKTLPSIVDRTTAMDYAYEKQKSLKMEHRCFPRLVPLRSFHGNKKPSNPALSVNGSKTQKSGRSSEKRV